MLKFTLNHIDYVLSKRDLYLYRRRRVRGDERYLREWTMHQYRRWSNLRVSSRISIKRETKFTEVHRCKGGSMLR